MRRVVSSGVGWRVCGVCSMFFWGGILGEDGILDGGYGTAKAGSARSGEEWVRTIGLCGLDGVGISPVDVLRSREK